MHEMSTIQDRDAYTRMLRARTGLVLRHPFFASLALRLRMREDPTCRTAWTDGRVLAYNPMYVSVLSPEKLEGLTAHLVMHPACGHHRRRQGRDPRTWNRACDYVINWILLDAGLTLPDGHLFLERHRGANAESVYEILCDEKGEEDNQAAAEDSAQSEEEGQESDEEQDSDSGAGANNDGETDEDEESSSDPGLAGEVRDDPGEQSLGDSGGAETDWEQAMIQAALNARDAGRLPLGLERLVEEMIAPRLSWRELLQRFVSSSARSDYSWLRPNRRHLHQNLYLPSLNNHELGEVVIAVDTSGSIEAADLQRFAAEIGAILEQCPATVHLLYCDMEIVRSAVFQRHDPPLILKPVGGGGTDFRPVFDHVARSGLSPDCLIYLTDLDCDLFPEFAPVYPVLWLHTGPADAVAPPFGDLVRLQPSTPAYAAP